MAGVTDKQSPPGRPVQGLGGVLALDFCAGGGGGQQAAAPSAASRLVALCSRTPHTPSPRLVIGGSVPFAVSLITVPSYRLFPCVIVANLVFLFLATFRPALCWLGESVSCSLASSCLLTLHELPRLLCHPWPCPLQFLSLVSPTSVCGLG